MNEVRRLFLDMDGVVNSEEWWRIIQRTRDGLKRMATAEPFARLVTQVDPRAVARLNLILEMTQAEVVLSSTWRTVWGLEKTQQVLQARGFAYTIKSCTPDLAEQQTSGLYSGAQRGSEIKAWLDAQEEHGRFVILDDDSDMGALLPHLIQTATAYGLTDAEMVRAIHRLRG